MLTVHWIKKSLVLLFAVAHFVVTFLLRIRFWKNKYVYMYSGRAAATAAVTVAHKRKENRVHAHTKHIRGVDTYILAL